MGIEPTISAGERQQTYALDRAATGTGTVTFIYVFFPAEPLKTNIYKYKFNSIQKLSFLISSKYNTKYREKKKSCGNGKEFIIVTYLTLRSYGSLYLVNVYGFNPLNAELNPICYLMALLAHHFLHVSRIRVKSLTLMLLRAAHLLRSWVRIPPGAWIFVCCECRVLSGRGLCKQKNYADEGFFLFSTVPPGICTEIVSPIKP